MITIVKGDQAKDQSNRLEAKISKEGTNYTNDRFTRNSPTDYQNFSPRPNFAYGNNNPKNGRSYDQLPFQFFNKSDGNRSRSEFFDIQNQNWRYNGIISRSPST